VEGEVEEEGEVDIQKVHNNLVILVKEVIYLDLVQIYLQKVNLYKVRETS